MDTMKMINWVPQISLTIFSHILLTNSSYEGASNSFLLEFPVNCSCLASLSLYVDVLSYFYICYWELKRLGLYNSPCTSRDLPIAKLPIWCFVSAQSGAFLFLLLFAMCQRPMPSTVLLIPQIPFMCASATERLWIPAIHYELCLHESKCCF